MKKTMKYTGLLFSASLLGTFAVGHGSVVSADEINAVTEEATIAPTVAETVTVAPTEELAAAIDEAKSTEGINVVEASTVDVGAVVPSETSIPESTIATSYAQQATDITNQVTDQQAKIAEVEAYNVAEQARYDAEQKIYQETLTTIKDTTVAEANGLVLFGDYDETKKNSAEYYGGFKLINNNEAYTDNNFIQGSLGWTDTTEVLNVENATVRVATGPEAAISDGTLYVIEDLKKGTSFTISNIGLTRAGTSINAKFTIAEEISQFGTERLRVYESQNGDKSIVLTYLDLVYLPLTVDFIDNAGNPLTLVQVLLSGDVDTRQGLSVEFNELNLATLNSTDSSLEQLGNTNIYYESANVSVNDFNKAPVGTIAHAGVGSRITYTHYMNEVAEKSQNDPSQLLKRGYSPIDWSKNIAGGTQLSLFGNANTAIEVVKIPDEPVFKTIDPLTVTYRLMSYGVYATGSHIIEYKDENGNDLIDYFVDTAEGTLTGTTFNTTEPGERPGAIIKDGVYYNRIDKVEGLEAGTITEGIGRTVYYYEPKALEVTKDVLNSSGESINHQTVKLNDVLTYELDGAPVSDELYGGLYRYDFRDHLDSKLEFVNGSVKVLAGKYANLTLDGQEYDAGDDLLKYVDVEYSDGFLTVIPKPDFYSLIQQNGITDIVDLDVYFDAAVKEVGEVTNTYNHYVNTLDLESNTTVNKVEKPEEPNHDVPQTPEPPKSETPTPTPQTPEPPKPETPTPTPQTPAPVPAGPSLPNTGTNASQALSIAGIGGLMLSVLAQFGLVKRKAKED